MSSAKKQHVECAESKLDFVFLFKTEESVYRLITSRLVELNETVDQFRNNRLVKMT
jgi:hypothetical protein